MAYTKPCGTPIAASACASGKENAMIGIITPLTFAELSSIDGKSLNFSVPRMNPKMIVTTTAVAPASVGVRLPEKIPQKIIIGTMNAYQPDLSERPTLTNHSVPVNRSEFS